MSGGTAPFPARAPTPALVCSVCSESAGDLVRTECGHSYHLACLLRWCGTQSRGGRSTTCPDCRRVLHAFPAPAVSSVVDGGGEEESGGGGPPLPPFPRVAFYDSPTAAEMQVDAEFTMHMESIVRSILSNRVGQDGAFDAFLSNMSLGHLDSCAALLDRVPELIRVRRHHDGTTLLHHAAQRNKLSVLDMLLRRHANPNCADRFGRTPMHASASVRSPAGLRRLLARRGNPNASDRCGATPLMLSVRRLDVSSVNALLQRGADVDAADSCGETVCHTLARLRPPAAMLHAVAEREPTSMDRQNADGDTPLHLAVASDNAEFIYRFRRMMPMHLKTVPNMAGVTPQELLASASPRTRLAVRTLDGAAAAGAPAAAGAAAAGAASWQPL